MRKGIAAEFIGTFCLVFAGTGAIIINELTGGVLAASLTLNSGEETP